MNFIVNIKLFFLPFILFLLTDSCNSEDNTNNQNEMDLMIMAINSGSIDPSEVNNYYETDCEEIKDEPKKLECISKSLKGEFDESKNNLSKEIKGKIGPPKPVNPCFPCKAVDIYTRLPLTYSDKLKSIEYSYFDENESLLGVSKMAKENILTQPNFDYKGKGTIKVVKVNKLNNTLKYTQNVNFK